MKKHLLTFIFSLLLALTISLPAFAVGNIQIYIDGESLAMDTKPTITNGTTLVPMRAVFEALGATVDYDAASNKITGAKGSDTITLTLNQTTATKNNTAVQLSAAPQVINGRTLVPLRFISESLNCTVDWNADTQTITITSANDTNTSTNTSTNTNTNAASTLYDVVRVVDGDTIVVNYNGTQEKVRLIGIDTPESVHPDASKNTEAGEEASAYTKSLLTGKQVGLEFDVQERDKYGRLLAYVYLDGVMVNKTLLEKGYANIATYPPNVKYVDDFTKIVAARNNTTSTTTSTSTATSASTSTTTSTSTSTNITADTQIYRTPTGKKYHINPNCNGGTYIPCTLEEAKAANLTPCSKCIG